MGFAIGGGDERDGIQIGCELRTDGLWKRRQVSTLSINTESDVWFGDT